VANRDADGALANLSTSGIGYSCIAEIRMIETIQNGAAAHHS